MWAEEELKVGTLSNGTVENYLGAIRCIKKHPIAERKFPYAIRTTIGRMFRKKDASDGTMTPFQAVCTALAATVGTGNIAGVAGAIAIGGPGAVFWMWCSALLGMCTKFSEVTLAVHFRERNKNGEIYFLKVPELCRLRPKPPTIPLRKKSNFGSASVKSPKKNLQSLKKTIFPLLRQLLTFCFTSCYAATSAARYDKSYSSTKSIFCIGDGGVI